MASNCGPRQALAAMASILTAFTSATGISTATFAASMASQVVADTSLTLAEKQIITALTTGYVSATPSAAMHALTNPYTNQQIFSAMVSILTAYSSATGTSTTNWSATLARQQAADTTLTNVETGLVTLLTRAAGSATPSLTAKNEV